MRYRVEIAFPGWVIELDAANPADALQQVTEICETISRTCFSMRQSPSKPSMSPSNTEESKKINP